MNIDFRLSVGLFRHPKFIKLRRRIGAEGALAYITLLAFVAQNHPDGNLEGMDADDIAIAGDYDGDAKEFAEILLSVRLLEREEGDAAYRVHDWQEHNPWAAAAPARSDKARRAAEARWAGRDTVGTTEDSKGDRRASGEDCSPDAKPTRSNSRECKTHSKEHATSIAQASSSNAPNQTSQSEESIPPYIPPVGGEDEVFDATQEGDTQAQPTTVSERDPRGTRLPEGWEPDEQLLAWAATNLQGVNVAVETENFRDYWHSLPGPKGRKLDWGRTWQVRMREVMSRIHPSRAHPGTTSGGAAASYPANGFNSTGNGVPLAKSTLYREFVDK